MTSMASPGQTPSPPATFFDRWSQSYDGSLLQRSTYEPVHDAVLELVADERPQRILDLGCGTGHLTARLRDHFPDADVIGADYSLGMLERAMRRERGDHLVQADAMQLPLRPGSLDLITCSESFHWYPDQRRAARGLANLLAPNGRLVIASIAMVTTVGSEIVESVTARRQRPIKALPPKQLAALLDDVGFEVTSQRRVPRLGVFGWPVLTGARLARR